MDWQNCNCNFSLSVNVVRLTTMKCFIVSIVILLILHLQPVYADESAIQCNFCSTNTTSTINTRMTNGSEYIKNDYVQSLFGLPKLSSISTNNNNKEDFSSMFLSCVELDSILRNGLLSSENDSNTVCTTLQSLKDLKTTCGCVIDDEIVMVVNTTGTIEYGGDEAEDEVVFELEATMDPTTIVPSLSPTTMLIAKPQPVSSSQVYNVTITFDSKNNNTAVNLINGNMNRMRMRMQMRMRMRMGMIMNRNNNRQRRRMMMMLTPRQRGQRQ